MRNPLPWLEEMQYPVPKDPKIAAKLRIWSNMLYTFYLKHVLILTCNTHTWD